jgi:hypothetical protein
LGSKVTLRNAVDIFDTRIRTMASVTAFPRLYELARSYAPATLSTDDEKAMRAAVHRALNRDSPAEIVRMFEARNLFDLSSGRPWSQQANARRKCKAWLETDLEVACEAI